MKIARSHLCLACAGQSSGKLAEYRIQPVPTLALDFRNRTIAGNLFRWLQESRPESCTGWDDKFRLTFAKDALG